MFKLLILFPLLFSCNLRNNSLKHFFSEPSFDGSSNQNNFEQIFVLSSNSFEGRLNPTEEIFEKLPPLKVGGMEVLTTYIDITREKYPNLLLVDGGHLFNPNSKDVSKEIDFYNSLDMDAVALTDTDLNLLKSVNKKMDFPLINSNFMDLKSGSNVKLKNLSNSKIIKKGDLKIAVLSVFEPKSGSSVLTGIYIKDPIFSLLKEKELLSKEDVHLVILMATIKSNCLSNSPLDRKSFKDFGNYQLNCPENDHLFKFISRLPPNFIDLIILNNKKFADGFIGDIPIIQNPGKGKYLGRVKITYDMTTKKIIKENSEILPPLKTCHYFFASTEDCHLGQRKLSYKEKKRIQWIQDSKNKIAPAIYLGEKLIDQADSITN